MSLATYSDLKTSVASWLNRTDLTSAIPDFIALAEADIRLDVRTQAMEQYTTGTLTGETLAHPTRFIEARRLVVSDEVYEYITPVRYQTLDNTNVKVFTSIGTNFYIMDATSGLDYSLLYYQSYAAFSADADTNDLLTTYPDLYLAGACKYGAAYLKDTALEQQYQMRYTAAVNRVMTRENRRAYARPLQVRAA